MDTRRAWWQAARPHTLPAAATPVLVGAGLATGDGVFRWGPFLAAMFGALAIQVAANFTNDLSDARKGADTDARIGPPRMVASGIISERQMAAATAAAFVLASIAGVYLIVEAGWVIAAIGLTSIVAAIGYVGGPRPYGYRGLGELFVFVFFGLIATVTSRYVHDQSAPLDAWLLAIPVGLLVTAILVANNVRDIETDAEAGKRTLAVIIGRERTRTLFAVLVFGSFVAIAIFGVFGWTAQATLFAVFLAPFSAGLVRTVYSKTEGPALVRVLKGTARLHLLVGLVLAAGAAMGQI
ncbi:MAG: 1,4-dihydroxy-2-naphthoate polyprenyltransferase [Acidimicrobiia bacterium]|nr:1,4-dihydroxy-2-naphthoate polyprenyltransferase [Acidimicrobiia bacterium]